MHTEDHPLEYAEFDGDIPAGEYGAGRMFIYDRGTYTTEKWRDGEVMVVLHGSRVSGRYVLFRTGGEDKDWMIHRMDPPEPGWTPIPDWLPPMTATPARRLPAASAAWGYEMAWDGLRAGAYISGAQLRLKSADGTDITGSYPELRRIAETIAPTECILDGEVVAFDRDGRVGRAEPASGRRPAPRPSVQYLVFDLLWLDGKPTLDLSYQQRRELLTDLDLAGPHWQTPPYFPGGSGRRARQASREQGLPGVVAKRLDSAYRPGEPGWLLIR